MESLTLYRTQINDPTFIQKAFPNLKCLTLRNKRICRCEPTDWVDDFTRLDYSLTNDDLKKLMESNPQLERLNIAHDKIHGEGGDGMDGYSIQINLGLLSFLNWKIPTLLYLDLDLKEMSTLNVRLVSRSPLLKVTFKNLTGLSVQVQQIDQLLQVGIMSDHLQKLSLGIRQQSNNYRLLSEFVGGFNKIEFLWIEYWPIDIRNQCFINMMKSLRNLKTLNIALDAINEFDLLKDLIDCFHEFQHITVFQIKCRNIHYKNRKSVLNGIVESDFVKNKWKGTSGGLFADFVFTKF